MMPAVMQLFAESRLPSVESAPIELVIAGCPLPSMVLTKISCRGANFANDVAVLTFRPVSEVASKLALGEHEQPGQAEEKNHVRGSHR